MDSSHRVVSGLENYGVSVSEFGALGDGKADDAEAIQRALDAGSTLVVIPFGRYKIGRSLRVRSGTRLRVHPSALLFLADQAGVGQDVFLLTNHDHAGGNENIEIEGGIWDGNNPGNRRGPDVAGSYTGVALNFTRVRDLHLRNLTVCDPESYFMRLSEVRDFVIEDIRFETRFLRPNQDGVHLCGGCEDGIIRRISARGRKCTNDDLVALNADDAMGRAQNLGGACGPISRIRIEDISADDCHSFVRLLSVWSPISDVTISGVRGGFRCNVVNADAARNCLVKVFDENDPQFARGVGHLKNISISNLDVFCTEGSNPFILLETRMTHFQIRNFKRDRAREASPSAPTFRIDGLITDSVVWEGITERDVANLQKEHPKTSFLAQRLVSPGVGQDVFRVACAVSTGDRLQADFTSFSLLEIRKCAMEPSEAR
jgi:hypothetical protein